MNGEEWWQGADLNRRPKAYESSALPLSYTAVFRVPAKMRGRMKCINVPDLSNGRSRKVEFRLFASLTFAGRRHDDDPLYAVF